jgi:site-specific DNA recombinase
VNGPDGKRYKKRAKITPRPEEEWIAVPIPDSGIPREWVDLARETIKDNVKFSQNDRRVWELCAGLARCAHCGWRMSTHTVGSGKSPKKNNYYLCSKVRTNNYSHENCPNRRSHRADRLEPLVWEYVSGVMKNPEELRADLNRMIELERRTTRGNPDTEAKLWAEKLAEVERKRAKYQEAFAADAVTLPELKAYLAQLDEIRKTAEHELELLRGRAEYVQELEAGRDALLNSLEAQAPEVLDSMTPEERHQWYKLLKLRADVFPDGRVEVSWAGAESREVVCEMATLSLQAVQ